MPALVARVREGTGTVAEVYASYGRDLYGYAAAVARDRGVAEDVVQEAFARLVREERAGRLPENPRAWLYTVATNLLRLRARRRAIAERWQRWTGGTREPEVALAAEEVVLRRERTSQLTVALAQLPRESRAALLLAADGFSGSEIAQLIGRSEGATRNLMWRARLALRDRLTEQGAR